MLLKDNFRPELFNITMPAGFMICIPKSAFVSFFYRGCFWIIINLWMQALLELLIILQKHPCSFTRQLLQYSPLSFSVRTAWMSNLLVRTLPHSHTRPHSLLRWTETSFLYSPLDFPFLNFKSLAFWIWAWNTKGKRLAVMPFIGEKRTTSISHVWMFIVCVKMNGFIHF